MTKQEEDNTGTPNLDNIKDDGRQSIASEVFALCDRERQRAEQTQLWCICPKQSFWDLCGHDVRCPQFPALQKWAE